MPGAAQLAARAAMHGGAGYVKLLGKRGAVPPAELVIDNRPLAEALADDADRRDAGRAGAGPRRRCARAAAKRRWCRSCPLVLDADALHLLRPEHLAGRAAPAVLTPHEGEMAALEAAFGLDGSGLAPRPRAGARRGERRGGAAQGPGQPDRRARRIAGLRAARAELAVGRGHRRRARRAAGEPARHRRRRLSRPLARRCGSTARRRGWRGRRSPPGNSPTRCSTPLASLPVSETDPARRRQGRRGDRQRPPRRAGRARRSRVARTARSRPARTTPSRHAAISRPAAACQLQHSSEEALADFVRDRVVHAAEGQGLVADLVAPPHLSPPRSRRRATLHAERKGGQVLLGFRARRLAHASSTCANAMCWRPNCSRWSPRCARLLATLAGQAARGRYRTWR